MSYKSPIIMGFDDAHSTTAIDDGIMRVVRQYYVNVDKKELVKALKYNRDQYQKGEWDTFELITSAWYGKQMYFKEANGMVYSRLSRKTMYQSDAVSEFLDMIGGEQA